MRTKYALGFAILLAFVAVSSIGANAQWKWRDCGVTVSSESSEFNKQKTGLSSCSVAGEKTIFVWQEQRLIGGVNEKNIYGQCIDQYGNKLWDPDGVLICGAANEQRDPKVITDINSDNVGGVVVMWLDYRDGAPNFYVQRITSTGAKFGSWPTDGAVVSNPSSTYPDTEADIALVRYWDSYNPMIAYVQGSELWVQELNVLNGGKMLGLGGKELCDPTCWLPKIVARTSEAGAYGTAIIGWEYAITFGGGPSDYHEIRMQKISSDPMRDPIYYWSDTGEPTDPDGVKLFGGSGVVYRYPLLVLHEPTNDAIVACERQTSVGGTRRLLLCRVRNWDDVNMRWQVIWPTVDVGNDGAGSSFDASLTLLPNNTSVALAYSYGDAVYFTHYAGPPAAPAKISLYGSTDCSDAKLVNARNNCAIVTFGNLYNVYAQMVDLNHSQLWLASGAPYTVCANGVTKTTQVICPDGAGGAVIGWIDASGSAYHAYCNRVIPEIACTIARNYVYASSGAPTGKSILSGCPQGDMHALKIDIDFNDAVMAGTIAAADITLPKPEGNVAFWEVGPITAEQDATAGNSYTSNIVQKYISGCNVCGGCSPAIYPVRCKGVRIGYATNVAVNSVDLMVNGNVDIGDVAKFASYYPPNSPPDRFCADYNSDGVINVADLAAFSAHYGPPGHHKPDGSTRSDAPGAAASGENADKEVIASSATSAAKGGGAPLVTSLGPNYPNPFNPSTIIEYSLATASHVDLTIYNVKGQLVRTLVDESMPASRHSVLWDGKDSSGRLVPSGFYFYRMKAGAFVESRKMVLIR